MAAAVETHLAALIHSTLCKVRTNSFDPEAVKKFREDVQTQLAVSPEGHSDTMSSFSHTVCDGLKKLFMVENCEHIVSGMRFFYTALLLTDDDTEVQFSMGPKEGDVQVSDQYGEVHAFLLKAIYKETYLTAQNYQEIFNLLGEMTAFCMEHYNQNPCVSYLISQHVYNGYTQLNQPKASFKLLCRKLVLLLAKCALIKKCYSTAEKKAKEAAVHLFDSKNAEAFEIWSEICQLQGKLSQARKLTKRADKCVIQHQQPPRAFDQPKVSERKLHKLPTLVFTNSKLSDKTTDEVTQHADAVGGEIQVLPDNENMPDRSSRDKKQEQTATDRFQRLDSFTKAQEEEVEEDESVEETSSGISDSSELDEDDTTSTESDSENHTGHKTWFQESVERYKNGEVEDQIMAGDGLDMIHISRGDYTGRTLIDGNFFDVEHLQYLLATDPDKYKQCCIRLDGPHKAVCKILEEGHTHEEIEIHGRGKCGHTFNDDEVLVEVLGKGEIKDVDEDVTYGKVKGVLQSNFRETEFPVLACNINPKERDVMHPTCKSVPRIYIWNHFAKTNYKDHRYRIDVYKLGKTTKRKSKPGLVFDRYFDILPDKRGQYVFLVVYISWDPHFNYPKGAVVKVLDCGKSFESGLIILENQFRVRGHYKRETVDLVNELINCEDVRSIGDQDDMRQLLVFTIDPPESKDLDDALSVWKDTKNGRLIVGVHITDVASLVKKGDAVDQEAFARKTSFFASYRRKYHMLPEPLSEDRLSLLEGKDRFAISVLYTMDKTGNFIGSPSVSRSLIQSHKKLSYQDAQDIIDGNQISDCSQKLKSSVRTLHILAQYIRKQRLKNSRFSSRFMDPRFITGNRQETPDAQALVEEFMVLTNHFIASWLMASCINSVPFRCQANPPAEKVLKWIIEEGNIIDMLVRLQDKCIFTDTTCDVSNRCVMSFHERVQYVLTQKGVWKDILNAANDNDFNTIQSLLCCDNMHPLQCLATNHWINIQEPAKYRHSCQGSESHLLHYSLNLSLYTHFTSPLRRYVDLVVHRLVHAVLDSADTPPYTQQEMETLITKVNVNSRRQKGFERGSRIVKRSKKLLDQPLNFNVVISSVNENGAKLCIPSLNEIPETSKELPFNLLDCCRKPELMNRNEGEVEVVCFWNKRLYRYVERQLRERQEDRVNDTVEPAFVHLDSQMHMECIPSHEFATLLRNVFKRASKKEGGGADLSIPPGENSRYMSNFGAKVLSSEGCGDVRINHHCMFSLNFSRGQVLRVQMHAEADKGMLTPYIQLFHICENLSLCLTHLFDPVETFAKYVTQSVRNRRFSSVEEYQKTWLSIVAMETATSSVGNEETIVIDNVKVKLFRTASSILGKIELDSKFCDFRQIEVGGKTIDRLEKMSTKESAFEKCSYYGSLDYLCLKYTPPEYDYYSTFCPASVWVGHALIKKVKQRRSPTVGSKAWQKKKDPYGGAVVITFKLRSNSIRPPSHLFCDSFTAVAEIIIKSEVDRRTEQMLEILNKEGTDLAKNIALSTHAHEVVTKTESLRLRLCKESLTDVTGDEAVSVIKNNNSQTVAIQKALVKPFSLIQGPPGTGKTSTGLKLVYLFHEINQKMHSRGHDAKQKQVLFCGPSNKSVDLVARYLMTKLGSLCPTILRMYGKTIENQDFRVPKRDLISTRSLRGLKSDPALRDVTLHHVIRQQGKRYAAQIKSFDEQFNDYFEDPVNNEVTLEYIKTYTRLVAKAEQEELKKCDVILCTCVVAGSRKLTEVSRISQCIIDESAMCPEPQSMIPIIATKPDQVVLIGDHRQLRPIIQCTQAAELGLDQSLFERYKEDATFLNIQYRMHEKICNFPSTEFYGGKDLRTGPDRHEEARWYIPPGKELSIWPVRDNPKVFCHVEGVEKTLTVSTAEGNEQSKSNLKEVDKVVEAFLYLVKKEKIAVKDINLMSQYNAQRHVIREKLEQIVPKMKTELTVQTVVASQGGEWDYVIFSTVRSLPNYKIETHATMGWCRHNLGFITDVNQINVALTRARKGLIIIGNSHLLQCNKTWKNLLHAYRYEKCLVDAADFPNKRVPAIPGLVSQSAHSWIG